MSEYTQCCHCSVKSIEQRAKANGQTVEFKRSPIDGFPSGTDVYVNGVWRGWMGKISDDCAC